MTFVYLDAICRPRRRASWRTTVLGGRVADE
jgi:hypothetical protein